MGTIPYCRQIAAWFQKKSGGYFYFEGGVRYERNRLQRSPLRENESRAGQIPGLACGQEPSEILNHTYEYTMREDIVMCMEELELEPEKARALLRSPCPLSDVYKEFRDRETEHMDTIRDSIETEADKSLQRQEKKQHRESR
jgi:hypothetical protein